MESLQIINNELEHRVFNNIETKYETLIKKLRQRLKLQHDIFNDDIHDNTDYLKKTLSKLDVLFVNFVNIMRSNKVNSIMYVKEFVQILTKIKDLNKQIKAKFSEHNRAIKNVCECTKETLDDFINDVRSDETIIEVYDSIINSRQIVIKRPIIGEIIIKSEDIEARLGKIGTDLYSYLEQIIDKYDFTMLIARRIQFDEECQELFDSISDIKNKFDSNKKTIIDYMHPNVINVIETLQQTRENQVLVDFVRLLDQVLEIYVELEVQPPDTNRDDLYAKFLDICVVNPDRQRDKRDNLIGLALDLGLDVTEFEDLSDLEICDKYHNIFNL